PAPKLSVLESRGGLIPDMTGTHTLVRLVGLDVAKELTFTGRMVSGEEAVRLGLATRVADDPHAAAMELARELVGKSPDALRHGKRLLNLSGTRPLAEQLADERETMASVLGSPNQAEATRAYFERRGPRSACPAGVGRPPYSCHSPRSASTSFSTCGRSVMIPSTPRSSRRIISSRSSIVH